MKTAPTTTVLTPVYNGEKYLDECIQSVQRQTRSDWEYVIVDNCSTDRTVAIAERYAAADARIRLVRTDKHVNVHQSHNRAAQFVHPGSRFCKFLGADDWLYPECLERLVAVAERNPSVGVVSSFRLEGDLVQNDGLLPYSQEVTSGREVIRSALKGPPWVTGSPTSLLFRADLVRARRDFFDQTVWHSDTDAAYRLLLRSELGFVHQVLSFTRLHVAALTSSFSKRLRTHVSNSGRMLARYGPLVLGREEYRIAMRSWLQQYFFFLAKQRIKPSRWRDREFHAFHGNEIRRMLEECRDDAVTRAALGACMTLLRPRFVSDKNEAAGPAPSAGASPERTDPSPSSAQIARIA